MIESWRIYYVALKKLPKGTLQKLYRRSARLVYRWAADPKYCEEVSRNPLDRIRDMLEHLDLAGYGEYSRAALDYLAEPLDLQCVKKSAVKSDKNCINGETADCMVALGKLADEIRFALADNHLDSAERIRIMEYYRKLISEVEQLLDAAGM